MTSQASSIPKNAITCRTLGNGWRLNFLYPNLATITRPNGTRQCTYIGFENELRARAMYTVLLREGYRTDLRLAERLSTQWELKVWGLSTEDIMNLLRNLAKGF
jgi:hypothetical protein